MDKTSDSIFCWQYLCVVLLNLVQTCPRNRDISLLLLWVTEHLGHNIIRAGNPDLTDLLITDTKSARLLVSSFIKLALRSLSTNNKLHQIISPINSKPASIVDSRVSKMATKRYSSPSSWRSFVKMCELWSCLSDPTNSTFWVGRSLG